MSRKWYPDILIDECLPEGSDSAEAWLDPDEANGQTAVYFDEETSMEAATYWEPGDTVVFQWCEQHGHIVVHIMPDGIITSSLRCPDTPDMFDGDLPSRPTNVIPSDVNTFCDEDGDIFAVSIDDFAKQYADNMTGWMHPDGETVVVFMARWSSRLSFIISADGKSLTPISPEVPNHVHG